MKANNALVLLWKGNNISDYLVEKIAEILITNGVCIPEMLTAKYMDENEVTNVLVHESSHIPIRFKNVEEADSTAEAIKESVIYIGKRFEASLKGTNRGLTEFTLELYRAISEARSGLVNDWENNTALLNAVKIISTANVIIPAQLAKKYHFTQNVVEIIKKIYNTYLYYA